MEHYKREGYVILTNIIDGSAVAEMKKGCRMLIDGLGESLKSEGVIDDLKKDAPFDRRIIEMCNGCEDR